jgi:CheY-like chemotaxis protein
MLRGHVLLVEDSEIIALDAEDMLTELGFESVAVASSCAEALGRIDARRPDLAVLDVNLTDETSYPVAEQLWREGIPFVFATGYGSLGKLPDALSRTPVVTKPYTPESLRRALLLALERAEGAGARA